ncbi:MAG: MBL fold metallo-hydrolase [Candidatus Scalinduaceae bacterium]
MSIPFYHGSTYGGNTTCLEVRCGETIIIFDTGTGIRPLSEKLFNEYTKKNKFLDLNILYTHLHTDHTIGLPFASFIYIKGNRINIYGSTQWDRSLGDIIKNVMKYPNFPVTLNEINRVGATMNYNNISEGNVLRFGKNQEIRIYNARLNHPGGVIGYRVEYNSKVFALATDIEHTNQIDPKLVRLAQNADILFYDTQYTDDEYMGKTTTSRKGWGHSTPEYAIKTARFAGVKRLVLTHHCPYHKDRDIAKIESMVQKLFPNSQAAYEGMMIDV